MPLQLRSVVAPALMGVALAAGLCALPVANVQAQQRAYAPEQLWTLSMADQERVITMEYAEQSGGRTIPNDQMRFYLDQVRLSRWTFSQVRSDIATSLRGNGNGNGGWRPPGAGGSIRCESTDGRSRTCNTPWPGQSRLTRQLSNAACVQGRSWFSSNGRVTVSAGCRAEFERASMGVGGTTTTVTCESTDGRFRTCGRDLVGRARLVRQLSNTRCVEGSNFGLRNGSVWVDRGCRGVFEARQAGGGMGQDYSVTCSSTGSRYATCAWDARYGMPRLVQQLSSDSCREGYSWGYSMQTGLWVNHGCRARFGTR